MENNLKKFKVIDLSGYSFSGKSAYFDLLCEFEGYKHYSKEFEFELIRSHEGILDLYSALVENWSPVRSSESIRGFKKLINTLGGDKNLLSRFVSIGYHYDYYFPNFTNLSNKYVEKLILAKWISEWPFAYNNYPFYKLFIKKILLKMGKKDVFSAEVYLSRFSQNEFINITKNYLNELLGCCLENNQKVILLNNAFETTNPTISHKFFNNVKSIIIDRDPRDVYLSAKNSGQVNGIDVGKSATGGSVENFIARFKLYRNNLINNENTLRINFENLVLDYENTLDKIFIFLNENRSIHKYPKKYFDPEISKKGVAMWKNVDGQLKKDIDKIYLELKDYCLDI
jgi:hypothetical protein